MNIAFLDALPASLLKTTVTGRCQRRYLKYILIRYRQDSSRWRRGQTVSGV